MTHRPLETPVISHLRFAQARTQERQEGLLGWLAFNLGDVRLDRVTLRRTWNGQLTLGFPVHDSRSGRRFPIVRPINKAARDRIESAVFRELRLRALTDSDFNTHEEER